MDKVLIMPPNHYINSIHAEVEAICNMLFCKSPISVFVQTRIFDNGDCIALTNQPNFLAYHMNNNYKVAPNIPTNLLSNQFYMIITENHPFNEVIAYMASLFNIHNTFAIFRRMLGYYDMFIFGLNKNDNGIINYYLNNIDMLNNYIDYFLEQSVDLNHTHMKHKLFIPEFMRPSFKGLEDKQIFQNNSTQLFYEEISKRLVEGAYSTNKLILTKRECDVLYFLEMGMTAKESAKQLYISPKTVEGHIANLKSKLGLYRRSEIMSFIRTIKSN